MASGRKLLHDAPPIPLRVFYWNGEDPRAELDRRFAAAEKHYGVTQDEIGDRLYYGTGEETPIVIAVGNKFGSIRINQAIIDDVVATIREFRLDVLIIDPFVSSHQVNENDNAAIDAVAKEWARRSPSR